MTEKCISFCNSINELHQNIIGVFTKFGLPLLIFIIRIWMAKIFWQSGMTKIMSWETTIALFKQEYKVPYINAELAAYLSTAAELTCPILLVLGFMTRLATVPMIAMTLVIQYTYLYLNEHYYWLMLLCTILFFGPGKLSLDHLIAKNSKSKVFCFWRLHDRKDC